MSLRKNVTIEPKSRYEKHKIRDFQVKFGFNLCLKIDLSLGLA